MAVPIQVGADRRSVNPGAPTPLFAPRLSGLPLAIPQYAVPADGQRFLINQTIDDPEAIPIRIRGELEIDTVAQERTLPPRWRPTHQPDRVADGCPSSHEGSLA